MRTADDIIQLPARSLGPELYVSMVALKVWAVGGGEPPMYTLEELADKQRALDASRLQQNAFR